MTQKTKPKPIRVRQNLGKYRIEKKLAAGGFAAVYQAYDTIEGIQVALKIPHAELVDDGALETFRREVRLTASLDHPHILPIKNADFIENHFVIVSQLGSGTLAHRLRRRLSAAVALEFSAQILDALACAHANRIVHCDVKPQNIILFPGNQLRLTDFGIAKVMLRTLRASGTGTLGFLAPEQAMGRPSFRSDVFSAGLLLYRMFSGWLPEWPYDWPPPDIDRVRAKLSPEMVQLIRRAMELKESRRFADARIMYAALERIRSKALGSAVRRRRRVRRVTPDWKQLRQREFKREYGSQLKTLHACTKCGGPVSETMYVCPWCSTSRAVHKQGTRFPAECPRCKRGVKLDWKYCAWCHGPAIGPLSDRSYSDVRYVAKCDNKACGDRRLMKFMTYCPSCRRKVRRPWKIEGTKDTCDRCGWGILRDYWRACPWCGKRTSKK